MQIVENSWLYCLKQYLQVKKTRFKDEKNEVYTIKLLVENLCTGKKAKKKMMLGALDPGKNKVKSINLEKTLIASL